MLPRHLQAFAGVQQAHVAALADHDRLGEREDAGERDVQIGQDADRRRARSRSSRKPWKLPGPALPASTSVVAPERRATGSGRTLSEVAAPVHVGVEVDQTRHHQRAVGRDGPGAARALDARRDLGDLAVPEGDVVRPSRPCAGSITRPPEMTRSYTVPAANLGTFCSSQAERPRHPRARCGTYCATCPRPASSCAGKAPGREPGGAATDAGQQRRDRDAPAPRRAAEQLMATRSGMPGLPPGPPRFT